MVGSILRFRRVNELGQNYHATNTQSPHCGLDPQSHDKNFSLDLNLGVSGYRKMVLTIFIHMYLFDFNLIMIQL